MNISDRIIRLKLSQVKSWKEQINKKVKRYSKNKRFRNAHNYWIGVYNGILMVEQNTLKIFETSQKESEGE